MEADPNMNSGIFPHYINHQVPSFSMQYNGSSGFDATGNIASSLSGNADVANGISFVMPPGSSPADMVLSPARRLVHGPAWSIEWSPQEQAILNHGLEEFANDPVISKYVKIAASLRTKTVRDVAMRCQWMKKEHDRRQKAEVMHIGKSMKARKERLASSSLGAHNQQFIQTASSSSQPVAHISNTNQNDPIPSEVWRLIEENNKALDQIVRNLEKGQMQNGALFSRVGSNIGTILHGINGMNCSLNCSLRKMPPIPVSINGDLFEAIWPNFSSVAHTSSNFNL